MRYSIRAAWSGLAAILAVGCSETQSPTTPATTLGVVSITVSTTGASIDFDASGYVLTVDGERQLFIGVNTTVSYDALTPGDHVFRLTGLAANCTIAGTQNQSSEQSAKVVSAKTSTLSFAVSCAPNVGAIRLTTETLGADPDADGYFVLANGISAYLQPPNGTQVISNVRVGTIELNLGSVAANCVVENPTRFVAVAYNATAEVPFTIRCVASASIRITAVTSGDDINPAGYTIGVRAVEANESVSQHVPPNGEATVSTLLPGAYAITVDGIQPNCRASSPTTSVVRVEAGTQGLVELAVSCVAATSIVYVVGSGNDADLFVTKSNGTGTTRLTSQVGLDLDPAWSPDGTKIVFSSWRNNNDAEIYVIDANGNNPVRLTNTVGVDNRPAWSPDGSRIAFISERDGNAEIYVMKADGSEPVRLTDNPSLDLDPSWSPDGSKIAFASARDGSLAIWVMNADGSGAEKLTSNTVGDLQPEWSPDGRKIAFSRGTTSSTVRDIFVINPDGSGLAQVTRDMPNASDPSWSPDGSSIAFSRTASECSYYYYYYYSCDSFLWVTSLDGNVQSRFVTSTPATEPQWRR